MLPAELSSLLPAGVGAIRSVERIKHGLTNDSWRVITEHDDLVVRRGNASESSLQIDRDSEARVLIVAAQAGLGPEVVVNARDRGLLVTRYAGATWTASEALEPGNIDRIAATFARLHALPIPDGVHRVDLRSAVRAYIASLSEHDTAWNLRAPELEARATHIVETLRRNAPECLCHNDVHALNIVDDGTLRLIDWEYAGIGDRYFDLASLCVYHTYDRQRRQRLLSSYLQGMDGEAYRLLELACWLFEYVRDLWIAVRESAGSRD